MKRNREGCFLFPVRLLVFLLACGFVVVGLWRREYVEVLGKAVRICLECIGIG